MGDTWELINHPMSDETGLELAAQMKRQNDILAGIAAGTAGAEFVIGNATFKQTNSGFRTNGGQAWLAKIPQKSSGAGGRYLPVMA